MTSTRQNRATAGRPAGRPGISYVLDVFSRMYPDARVDVGRTVPHDARSAWACLPDARDPWLLIPLGSRSAERAALDELNSRGHRSAARLARAAAVLGGVRLLPKIVVTGGGEDVESLIARTLGRRDVAVSMVVGKHRALQKPVLRVLARDGSTLAFAKVGVSEPTRELVRRETAALRAFECDPPRRYRTPRVLGAVEWRGLSLLLQEPMPGGRSPSEHAVSGVAAEISSRGTVRTTALQDSAPWLDLRARLGRLDTADPVVTALARFADRLEHVHAAAPVRTGMSHGDFTPWNVAASGASVHVWDWEGFADETPVGFDLLHYRFQQDVVVRGRHPGVAFGDLLDESSFMLSRWGLDDARLVASLYVIGTAVTALETRDTHARISRLSEWLPEALHLVEADGVPS